ncbi:mucin-5AC [Dasypus novemcinctus]|uniref:mucin-5AC n=1 Tax=Dasypus novemcinctus TaxID=9361 RepID=UPI0039C980C4
MGARLRELAPLWALALALACAQHTGWARDAPPEHSDEAHPDLSPGQQHPGGPLRGVTILPPMKTVPVVRALNAAHNSRVCSTWGNFHYKTFDGALFRFPGLCNYVFSAHCRAAYEDFNVQIRRGPAPNATALSHVTMKLDGLVVELTRSLVLVDGRRIQLPFSQSGVLIEQSSVYLKVVAKLGLVLMWNLDGSLLLELDDKYANLTCGLCGDFNGLPGVDEFLIDGTKLTATEFGNLQKLDGPTEQCPDPVPAPLGNCSSDSLLCEELLGSPLFSGCGALVDAGRYLDACRQDLCLCESTDPVSCLCHTLAEYSRQCAHAGGLPPDWRSPELCPQTCPLNMEYRECGSPCADTCSNLEHSQLCEDHCVAGCFCPQGMVLDDVGRSGCVPVSQCPCTYNGASYAPGAVYTTDCTSCTCSGGRWSCREAPCPGTCAVLGGSHFSTFDEKQFTVHGDCSYVLAKPCDSNAFTVLGELRKCGLTDSETCLKSVTLSLGGGQTVIVIKASGEVFLNQIYTQLPISAANVTVFRPSTFFIIAQTHLGLQLDVQLVPAMQVFVRLDPALRGLTCGLCGNFNQNQADDFRTLGGLVEGTGAAFANTWKTQASCPNIKNHFEDPCSLSVENEKYAQHWCSRLADPRGPFAPCHTAVNPVTYYSNCLFDTCNCERSEDCLCAALSAYVRACAAKGVLLSGWRDGACLKPTTSCPKSMTYHEHIHTCQPTCRSLSEEDVTCHVSFVPVDGCACAPGTFLDEGGKCVPASSCPCYYRGSVVPNGETLHDSGTICTCTHGALTCIGGHAPTPVCTAPMVYVDCQNATSGDAGAGCQKSCHTLDMACYSPQCVPGCVCPDGLVADGQGGCVAAADCPCVHNEASYEAGQTIRVGCNTCTCKSRMWHCTDEPCLGTCAVYGDGHYLTFDGQRYSFSGDCEYTLVQDHCSGRGNPQDAFRVVTENVPCGTTGTTCSKAIKIFLGSYELKLSDGKVEVIEKGAGQEAPYSIRQMGIYLVVDTDAGLVLLWDKRTSIFIRLSPEFKGKVCGLCGNFDDSAANDFTTRSRSVVGDVLEFGNSWKFSPSCPDALAPKDPCTANPYRRSWAQKQCSIINSATFAACRAHVEPTKYYEACVSDACACDSGGDCECFCTAVAAYAQACHEVGVCVAWRTPDVCPLFCDFYNPEGRCEWHYQPCGAPCLRTCRNPSGKCFHDVCGLEGCYPKCPPEAPIFDEDQMQCVAKCPPPPPPPPCHVQGKHYRPGAPVPSVQNCQSCVCTESGVRCVYDAEACTCTYDGQQFHPGEVIYHTTDGTGGCLSAHCGANGTIERRVSDCGHTTSTPPTTFSFSTPPVVLSTTSPPVTSSSPVTSTSPMSLSSSTPSVSPRTPSGPPASSPSTAPSPTCTCQWSPWLDVSHPGRGLDSGDFDTLENLRAHGYRVCRAPRAVQCRAEEAPDVPLQALGQRVECSAAVGLICYNRDQVSGQCDNYQIRVLCCTPESCFTSTSTTQTTPSTTSRHVETSTSPRTHTVTSTPVPGPSTPVRTTPSTPSPTGTTHSVSSTTTQPGTSPISCLQDVCSWTEWIDGSYPASGIDGGDFDTFHNLRSKGYKFCDKPKNVECRAERFPNTPLPELEQNVICSKTEGLLCLNKDQLPPICYNYEIRIQCCEVVDVCRQRTTAPATTKTKHSTKHTPEPTTRTMSTTTAPVPTTTTTVPTTTMPVPFTTTFPVPETTTTTPGTTTCHLQCSWTKWFDVDFPSPGPHGGDVETYNNIIRRGEKICHHHREMITRLECRAEKHPEVSIDKLGQVVECNPDVGLVCRNQDQVGRLKMCLNYEIRVLCCEPKEGCRTTTTPTTGTKTVTGLVTTTEPVSTTTPLTSSASTSGPSIPSSSPSTATTPVPETTTTVSTTTVPVGLTTTTVPTTTMPVPSPTTIFVPPTTSTGPSTSLPPFSLSTTSVPGTGTTPSTTRTTNCQMQCSWTKWFDVDFPSPGPHGGDMETYKNIIRRGEKICHHHREMISRLECRAENHPEISIDKLGQVVECNPDVGLVCRNQDQGGRLKMCLNYEIRVLCCKHKKGCPPMTTTPFPTESVTMSTTTAPVPTATTTVPTTTMPVPFTTTFPVPETTTTTPGTTKCHLQCSWTKWFDVDFPSPGPHGGDVETYNNIIRRGEKICHRHREMITRLECRAEKHPEVSIDKLGQVVECNPDVGLVCRNQDQVGRLKMCLNYEIRVLCCEPKEGCRTTTTPTTGTKTVTGLVTTTEPVSTTTPLTSSSVTSPATSTEPVHTTSFTSAATSKPVSTTTAPVPTTTSTVPTTTMPVPFTTTFPVPETTTTTPGTTTCHLQCSWTKWFDVDFPSPGPHGGDVETYNNIIRRGEKICHHHREMITRLECRAEKHPEVSIDKLGQVVECNPDVGLVCRNQDQVGRLKMCLNYEIRVLCCEHKGDCGPTTTTPFPTESVTSPATSTEPVPTTPLTSSASTSGTSITPTSRSPATTHVPRTSKPVSTTTAPVPTATTTVPTTTMPVPFTTTFPVPETSTATPGTTKCHLQCSWTKWFDVDFPSPGPHGGDVETYNNIIRRGEKICHRHREMITRLECRAEKHPEVSIDKLGQVVECNPDVGLVCRNQDQVGRLKMCLNYEIRVLCCEPKEGCRTTTTPTTGTKTVTGLVTTTEPVSTTTPLTSSASTSGPSIPSSSPSTATTPVPETTTTVSTTTAPVGVTTTTVPTTTMPVPSPTTIFVPLTTSTGPSTSLPPFSLSTTSVPGTGTTPSTTRTTNCQMQCSWTKWFDVDFPSPGPHGGDMETYKNIIRRGEKICHHHREMISRLECRAEKHPEVSIDKLGQVVECNPDVGLVCRNQDQGGRLKMCLNYEIRVLCCEHKKGCPPMTTTPFPTESVTSPATSTEPVHTTSFTSAASTSGTSITPTSRSPATTHVPRTSKPVSTTTAPVPTTTSTVPTTTMPVPFTTTFPVPETTTTTPGTTTCHLQCSWTKWFDVDFPSPGPHSGDVETYNNIIRRGEKICHHHREMITRLECRAEKHPEVSIDKLGQVVECNPDVGLVCRNQDQVGRLKMCLNYEIRVLCCEHKGDCGPTTTTPFPTESVTSPATSTEPVPTTPLTSSASTSGTSITPTSRSPATTHVPRTSKPVSTTTAPVPTATTTVPTTTMPVPFTTTFPVPETSTTTPGTTMCHLQCSWTKWFDVDFPSPGPHSGDVETYNNIIRRGEKICHHHREMITRLECRAEKHPEVSIDKLGQVVECNPDVGLVCRNQDQVGRLKMCLNYEIRVLCCEPKEGCRTTTTPTTGTKTVTGLVTTTEPVSTTTPLTSSASTSGPSIPSSSPSTATTPVPETTTKVSTTTAPVRVTTTTVPTTTMPVPSPTTIFVPPTTSTGPSTSLPPFSLSTTSVPGTGTTPSTTRTTNCQMQCSWTKWFDVDFPSPGPHGGDMETYKNIIRRGEKICHHHREMISRLECRAENHPEISIDKLGQVVECNPDVGLVCRNQDQGGRLKMCLNYEIRVLCCEPKEGCPPTITPITGTKTVTGLVTYTEPVSTSSASTSGPSVPSSSPSTTTTPVPGTTTTVSTTTAPVPVTTTTVPTTTIPVRSTTTIPVPPTTSPSTSPTPVPASSTSVPEPGTTHSTTGTTNCQMQCSWTKWFDVDFPSPGPHDGDVETYNNIIRRGEKICHHPNAITRLECRAENHPEVSIDKLGQVVECNPDVGLVCRNQDQVGRLKMCLNYEIRVLCCEPHEGCYPSTVSTPTTLPTSTLPPVSTSVSTVLSTSVSTVSSTSVCYCHVFDQLYPSGSIIYRKTDLTGHCYYAHCSQDCHVIRHAAQDCPATTTPATPATPPPSSTHVSSSQTTVPSGCPDAVPPRKKGETWTMPNCTQATCKGDNIITLGPRTCPQKKKPTCANGYPALKVVDEDGCCSQYKCQCVCSGWGDPHYITFDGTYYTFLDNCTYVLVQQIVPVYGHFRVLIDNYFCDAEDGLSCPQSIIVEYQKDRVVLTRKPVNGVMTNEIIFNNKVVRPGFRKDGIIVSQLGIKMYVTIPKIGVQVMFSGLIFSVEVPFSKFSNNTEGQCGTCTNDRKDECRLPGGAVATSCSEMSGHWRVHNNQSHCDHVPTPGPPTSPTTCPPSPICQLILSEVFVPCHAVIPPQPYYEGCVFDQCHMPDWNVTCSGLELYASLCASSGVCIDWRGRTNNTCPFTCPPGKQYLPCGPTNLTYCYGNDSTSLEVLQDAGPITEGCFCPDGMMLFSSSLDTCVPTQCPTCNRSYCPNLENACPPGTRLVLTHEEGGCCPGYTCIPSGCSVNGTFYQPGAVVSSDLCGKCWCETDSGPEMDLYVVKCEMQICDRQCPKGFEYQEQSGQCCGSCEQVACVLETSDGATRLLYPGEIWSRDSCVMHECEVTKDGLSVVTIKKACPPLQCSPEAALLSADGCCKHCPLTTTPQPIHSCALTKTNVVIQQWNCSSEEPVSVAYCGGNCGDTYSKFSFEDGVMQRKCQCCQELRTSPRTVTLRCADGSRRAFSYLQVEKCGCMGLQCGSPASAALSAAGPEGGEAARGQAAGPGSN